MTAVPAPPAVLCLTVGVEVKSKLMIEPFCQLAVVMAFSALCIRTIDKFNNLCRLNLSDGNSGNSHIVLLDYLVLECEIHRLIRDVG